MAEHTAAAESGRAITLHRYPLAPGQIALRNCQDRLILDEDFRNTDPHHASFGYIDDQLAQAMKDSMADKLADGKLLQLAGDRIERYRHLGTTAVEFGTPAPSVFRNMKPFCVLPNKTMAIFPAQRFILGSFTPHSHGKNRPRR